MPNYQQIINQRYQLEHTLGECSVHQTWLGRDLQVNVSIVIKVLYCSDRPVLLRKLYHSLAMTIALNSSQDYLKQRCRYSSSSSILYQFSKLSLHINFLISLVFLICSQFEEKQCYSSVLRLLSPRITQHLVCVGRAI